MAAHLIGAVVHSPPLFCVSQTVQFVLANFLNLVFQVTLDL